MQWGHTRISPNQYIVLIGPSGGRKGEPVTIAQSFMKDLKLNMVSESIIREALIRRMKQVSSEYTDHEGHIKAQCAIAVVAEELSVFLGEGNIRLLADLTNWYDARDTWTYETKHSGTDDIFGVCVNILGSMAPDWIPLTIPHGAIGGGFTSRIIFVVEHGKGRIIADPNEVVIDNVLRESIARDLEVVKQLTGEFKFTPDARDLYMQWYVEEEEKAKQGRPSISDPRFSGYVSRRATHIKKISMAISAARASSLLISDKDFLRAKSLMLDAEVRMAEVFGKVGRAVYTEQVQEVLSLIQARKEVSRSEIMRIMYRDIDETVMKSIEATLLAMRVVKRKIVQDDLIYIWLE